MLKGSEKKEDYPTTVDGWIKGRNGSYCEGDVESYKGDDCLMMAGDNYLTVKLGKLSEELNKLTFSHTNSYNKDELITDVRQEPPGATRLLFQKSINWLWGHEFLTNREFKASKAGALTVFRGLVSARQSRIVEERIHDLLQPTEQVKQEVKKAMVTKLIPAKNYRPANNMGYPQRNIFHRVKDMIWGRGIGVHSSGESVVKKRKKSVCR